MRLCLDSISFKRSISIRSFARGEKQTGVAGNHGDERLDEENEAENTEEGEYDFSQSGQITEEVLDEYLEKLQVEIDAINVYTDPFGADALSDEKLGI